jgi:hypothetical protein
MSNLLDARSGGGEYRGLMVMLEVEHNRNNLSTHNGRDTQVSRRRI